MCNSASLGWGDEVVCSTDGSSVDLLMSVTVTWVYGSVVNTVTTGCCRECVPDSTVKGSVSELDSDDLGGTVDSSGTVVLTYV